MNLRSRSMQRDAAIAGLGEGAGLDEVRKRRSHLSVVMLTVVVALTVTTALVPFGTGSTPVDPGMLRVALVVVSVTFLAYAVEKERALRRLEAALDEKSRLEAALSCEIERLYRLSDLGRSVGSSLALDQVCDVALNGAVSLFDAPSGALYLDRGDVTLQTMQGALRRLDVTEQRARQCSFLGEAVLFGEDMRGAPPGMATPLTYDGRVVGVIVLEGAEYTESDANACSTLAGHAATAIAHARAYQAERRVNEQFGDLESVRSEFSWLVASA